MTVLFIASPCRDRGRALTAVSARHRVRIAARRASSMYIRWVPMRSDSPDPVYRYCLYSRGFGGALASPYPRADAVRSGCGSHSWEILRSQSAFRRLPRSVSIRLTSYGMATTLFFSVMAPERSGLSCAEGPSDRSPFGAPKPYVRNSRFANSECHRTSLRAALRVRSKSLIIKDSVSLLCPHDPKPLTRIQGH